MPPDTGGTDASLSHAGALRADRAEHTPPAALPAVSPVPLPLAFTRFFGRMEERETLIAMLQDGTRLVTLTGPGGAGKTRLALEVAAHFQARSPARSHPRSHARNEAGHASEDDPEFDSEFDPKFDSVFDVVCFVSLADVSEAGRICAAVASALGLPRYDGADMQRRVAEHLRAQKTLLALDNYEHLADRGAMLVRALLRDCPGLTCLVTSRQPLHLEAERQFPIPPLALPLHAGTPERLKEFASVQLFVDRAQAARPDFALTDRNAPQVAALCARLEGVPLALELAAGWAGVLTPAQMLARMERPFDLLVSRHKDISPRHRTLWSALGLVSALGPFWSCRGYVQEGREHAARALNRAQGQDLPTARARALITAGNLANDRGDYDGAIAHTEEARALYEEMRHSEGALMCLCNLGRFALHSEQHDRAHTLLTQAQALSREQGLRSTEGYVLHNLGELATRRGEWAASLRFHRQEQAIGEEMGDRHLIASSLTGMADNALGRDDLEQAEALYRQSLHISSETGQRGSLPFPLAGLIRVASARRQWERAACLLGVLDVLRANTGISLSPDGHAATRNCQAEAQAALGEAQFARIYAHGQGMPLEEAIAQAMQEDALACPVSF